MSFICRRKITGPSPEELLSEQILVQKRHHSKLLVEIFG